jgi:hypothetical protein
MRIRNQGWKNSDPRSGIRDGEKSAFMKWCGWRCTGTRGTWWWFTAWTAGPPLPSSSALFSSTQLSYRYISFLCGSLFAFLFFLLFCPSFFLSPFSFLRSSHLLSPRPGTYLSFSCGSLFSSFFFSVLLSFYLLSPSCTLLIYSALVQAYLFECGSLVPSFSFSVLLSFYLLPHLRSSHLLGPRPGTSLFHVVRFSLLYSLLFFILRLSFCKLLIFSFAGLHTSISFLLHSCFLCIFC